MQNFTIPIEWVFIAFTAVALFLPYILLWNEDKVSIEQLRVLRPEAAWVAWVHPLISMAWVVLIALAAFGVLPFQLDEMSQKKTLLIIAVLVLAVETFNGILAAISGVYTLSRRRRMGSTRYVSTERARLVGLVQVVIDGGLIAAIFIFAM